MNFNEGKMSTGLKNWLADVRFQISTEITNPQYLAYDFINPLIDKLTVAASDYNLIGKSVEFIETNNAEQMEQFLYTSVIHTAENESERLSIESALTAFQANGEYVSFKRKSLMIQNSPEGPVRCEQTIGVPQFDENAYYVVGAKLWILLEGNKKIAEEVSIMLYTAK